MSKLIPLNEGYSAIVDDADFEWLSQWNWTRQGPSKRNRTAYAIRTIHDPVAWAAGRRKATRVYMHRALLPGVRQIDHKNHNGLDNQRGNLRPATGSQNCGNRPPRGDSKTGIKGVRLTPHGRWHAQLNSGTTNSFLGSYRTKEEAARAYDAAALARWGDFAYLNKI